MRVLTSNLNELTSGSSLLCDLIAGLLWGMAMFILWLMLSGQLVPPENGNGN